MASANKEHTTGEHEVALETIALRPKRVAPIIIARESTSRFSLRPAHGEAVVAPIQTTGCLDPTRPSNGFMESASGEEESGAGC